MSVFFDKKPPRRDTGDPKRLRSGKPDIWERIPLWFGSLAWMVALGGLAVADRARPVEHKFFDRAFGVSRPSAWDTSLLDVAFWMMVVTLGLVAVGLFANARRLKRKGDRVRMRLIIVGALASFAIGVHLVVFN